MGTCSKGSQSCSAGTWGKCSGEVVPTAEVCDNKDNDCNGKTDDDPVQKIYCKDMDQDGFGDPLVIKLSCTAPPGYSTNCSDCYDTNKDAFPGQKKYFNSDRGDGNFDYDCDGKSEKKYTATGKCLVKEACR